MTICVLKNNFLSFLNHLKTSYYLTMLSLILKYTNNILHIYTYTLNKD